ncbi:MAG: ATP-binding cassette domain-containing protein [Spirochaetaceae bacterium]|nr:MAG: ATP-binding cassette domain-containing protein [Spirochaetaceae bacterium]
MSATPAIELRRVTKCFSHSSPPAVAELEFSAAPGEVIGMLGENGAGKTTTLRMIAGLIRLSSGQLLVNGYDTQREPARTRRSVGALFGGAVGLYDRLSGRENIRYFAYLNGLSGPDARRCTEELIELLEMQSFAERRVSEYSSGMKQRAALARALVHRPEILLLDEPTTGLDIGSAMIVQQFVHRQKSEGKLILLSSHNIEELETLCDRVLILHAGHLCHIAQRDASGGYNLRGLYTQTLESVR